MAKSSEVLNEKEALKVIATLQEFNVQTKVTRVGKNEYVVHADAKEATDYGDHKDGLETELPEEGAASQEEREETLEDHKEIPAMEDMMDEEEIHEASAALMKDGKTFTVHAFKDIGEYNLTKFAIAMDEEEMDEEMSMDDEEIEEAPEMDAEEEEDNDEAPEMIEEA